MAASARKGRRVQAAQRPNVEVLEARELLARVYDLPCTELKNGLAAADAIALATALEVRFPQSPISDFIIHFLANNGTPFPNPPGVAERVVKTTQFKSFEKRVIGQLEEHIRTGQSDAPAPIRVSRPENFIFRIPSKLDAVLGLGSDSPDEDFALYSGYGGTDSTTARFTNLITEEVDTDGDGFNETINYHADVNYLIHDTFKLDPLEDTLGVSQFSFMLYLQNCRQARPFDTDISFTVPVSGSVKKAGDPIDLVFVIDTTRSMRDDIDAAKAAAVEIINTVRQTSSDFRVGIVTYRDFPTEPFGEPGDFVSRTVLPLTNDANSAIAGIRSISVGGGGDDPEAVYSALFHALNTQQGLGMWRANPVQRFIILMGDAPPHDPEPNTGYTSGTISQEANDVDVAVLSRLRAALATSTVPGTSLVQAAASNSVDIYTLSIGSDREALAAFRLLAEQNRGRAFNAESANTVVPRLLEAITEGSRVSRRSVAISGPSAGVRGQRLTFTLNGFDSSAGETDSFLYEIDWNGDGILDERILGSRQVDVTHVFAEAATYAISVNIASQNGETSPPTTHVVAIARALLQLDPLDPTKSALVVGGSSGKDKIEFKSADRSGSIVVIINGTTIGTFTPTGRIIAYGQAGDDQITVDPRVTLSTQLFGDEGNDTLQGGAGSNILVGGDGDDRIVSVRSGRRTGRNLFIGSRGSDRLSGLHRETIFVGDATAYDSNVDALSSILNEWDIRRPFRRRVANLSGAGDMFRVNGRFFLQAGITVTDDNARDFIVASRGKNLILLSAGDVRQ